jgi:uncharacterized protein YebE (UPF0316 family)
LSELLDALFAGPWGPLVIFLLRICDVSLSTLRMLLVFRNATGWVPLIAFAETLIWIFAVGNSIRNLQSPWHLMGYASGFAAGNVVGLWLERKMAYGYATVRIFGKDAAAKLGAMLRQRGFALTQFVGQGRDGPVDLLLAVSKRRAIPGMLAEVRKLMPEAFVTVEDSQAIGQGWLFQSRRK